MVLLVFVSLFISLGYFIYAMISRHVGYSGLLVSISTLIFLLLPGSFHAIDNQFPFYNMSYEPSEIQLGIIVCLVFYVFFIIAYSFFGYGAIVCAHKKTQIAIEYTLKLQLGLFISYAMQVVLILAIGMGVLLSSRSDISLSAGLIVTLDFARALSFATLFFCLATLKEQGMVLKAINIIIASLLFLAINFPLSLPRFILFGYVIFFFIYYFGTTRRSKVLIGSGFAIGVLTVFPLMSGLTRGKGVGEGRSIIEHYKTAGDFDGLQSVINIIKHVEINGYSFGNQMLSNVLAFIPRSLWEGKADPTGNQAADTMRYSFNNISAPLSGEFYMDLGILGVITGGAVFGVLCKLIDLKFMNNLITKTSSNSYVVGLVFYSMLIILQRGSLMGVINIFYANIFVFIIFLSLSKRKNKEIRGYAV